MDKVFIGIDPGVKTGLAISVNKQLVELVTTDIMSAQDWVLDKINYHSDHIVCISIENPNLRRWYGTNADAKKQGAGSIKRDFSIWKKFFKQHAIPYQEKNPKDLKTKINAESFQRITKWKGRTSEHSRDAAMQIFGK
mgnify:CR=1 FL=1